METPESCRECKAIAEELAIAYVQAWDNADPATRQGWTAIYRIRMRTEEDLQRVEELLQDRRRHKTQSSFKPNEVVRHRENPILRAWLKKGPRAQHRPSDKVGQRRWMVATIRLKHSEKGKVSHENTSRQLVKHAISLKMP
jgi:DNA-binding SARP family transcriptional activator